MGESEARFMLFLRTSRGTPVRAAVRGRAEPSLAYHVSTHKSWVLQEFPGVLRWTAAVVYMCHSAEFYPLVQARSWAAPIEPGLCRTLLWGYLAGRHWLGWGRDCETAAAFLLPVTGLPGPGCSGRGWLKVCAPPRRSARCSPPAHPLPNCPLLPRAPSSLCTKRHTGNAPRAHPPPPSPSALTRACESPRSLPRSCLLAQRAPPEPRARAPPSLAPRCLPADPRPVGSRQAWGSSARSGGRHSGRLFVWSSSEWVSACWKYPTGWPAAPRGPPGHRQPWLRSPRSATPRLQTRGAHHACRPSFARMGQNSRECVLPTKGQFGSRSALISQPGLRLKVVPHRPQPFIKQH